MFVPVRAGLVTEMRESILVAEVHLKKKKKVRMLYVHNVLNCRSFLKLKTDIYFSKKKSYVLYYVYNRCQDFKNQMLGSLLSH